MADETKNGPKKVALLVKEGEILAPVAKWPFPLSSMGRGSNKGVWKDDAILKLHKEVLQNQVDRLQSRIAESLLDSPIKRIARLSRASKLPRKVEKLIYVFDRNPDVVAEALFRSNGVCADCQQNAPFNRKSDGSPFLEVHHKIPLAEGGEDCIENAIAICPNCHRRRHHG